MSEYHIIENPPAELWASFLNKLSEGYFEQCFEYGDILKKWEGEMDEISDIKPMTKELISKKYTLEEKIDSARLEAEKIKIYDKVLEKLKPPLVFNFESITKKDPFHFRASGLNQVLTKSAARTKVIIGFSFSTLLKTKQKSLILGRIMQNIRLCKKYRAKFQFFSFAKTPFEMRSKKDLSSFYSIMKTK